MTPRTSGTRSPRTRSVLFGPALAAWLALWAWPASAQIQINEIRVDQPSTDTDEYFELKGAPGTALTGYTLLVIGDASGTSCGTIEAVVGLSAFSIQADGFLAVAESTATLVGFDQLLGGTNPLNFENSDNVTYLLVTGFSGALLDDIDTNDDGVIDVTPWTSIEDAVGLVGSAAIDCAGGVEYVYSATTVGPDAGAPPWQVFRCGDTGDWKVGDRDLGVTDTPGAANPSCAALPPDVQDEFRDPCVPLANGSATATVKVRLASSATLYWKVNGGSETSVPMSVAGTSGDTTWYEATIPGQPNDGDLVEYYVETMNANGTDLGFDQGYFVGTTPIATLRVNDADGLNVYRFYGARVRGNVTAPPGIFSTTNMDFYVQDATAGVNVFQFGPHPEQPQLGDDITVTSSIMQFNGKLEIGPTGACDQLDILIHGSGSPPAPTRVNACTPPESYEGLLVKMFHLTLDTGGDVVWGANRSYRGTNCTPDDSATVFIDVDTNIDGATIMGNYVDVVGIGAQFDFSLPFTSGYEITPRDLNDITYLDPLGVDDATTPAGLWLGPISPNPMGRAAEVHYRIPGSAGEVVRVRIQVVDVQGRLVATLFDGVQTVGDHRLRLDRGRLGGAAVHFLRLEVGGRSVARKIVYR